MTNGGTAIERRFAREAGNLIRGIDSDRIGGGGPGENRLPVGSELEPYACVIRLLDSLGDDSAPVILGYPCSKVRWKGDKRREESVHSSSRICQGDWGVSEFHVEDTLQEARFFQYEVFGL
jgi:hypothetical protein